MQSRTFETSGIYRCNMYLYIKIIEFISFSYSAYGFRYRLPKTPNECDYSKFAEHILTKVNGSKLLTHDAVEIPICGVSHHPSVGSQLGIFCTATIVLIR